MKRVIVNLAPADLKKEGADRPISTPRASMALVAKWKETIGRVLTHYYFGKKLRPAS